MWVRALRQEDPLQEGSATHSSSLAWTIPWTGEPVGCNPRGCKELDMTEATCMHAFMSDKVRIKFLKV